FVQIEHETKQLEGNCDDALAPFGIAAGDATALEQLHRLAAEKKVRDPEIKRKREDFHHTAPEGVDRLRHQIAELENLCHASESDLARRPQNSILNVAEAELDRLAATAKQELVSNQNTSTAVQLEIEGLEAAVEGAAHVGRTAKFAKSRSSDADALGLRAQATAARDEHLTLTA